MYWVTGILGLLLIVAPFILSFSGSPVALWSSFILGAVVLVMSVIKGIAQDTSDWEYWVAGIVGLLAIVAPFILGFSALSIALWTSIVLGVVIAILAGYQIFSNPHSHA